MCVMTFAQAGWKVFVGLQLQQFGMKSRLEGKKPVWRASVSWMQIVMKLVADVLGGVKCARVGLMASPLMLHAHEGGISRPVKSTLGLGKVASC
eukprot:scaffold140737_cov17-Tisochrysis_lutea.AAC.2